METLQTSMQSNKIEKYEFFLLLVLVVDLFMNFIPLYIYFAFFLILILRSTKIELSFIFIFFPGIMLTDIFSTFIVGYAALLLLLLIGFVLMYKGIRQWHSTVYKAMWPMIFILLGFFICYLYGPRGYYSGFKIIFVVLNGLAYFLFFVLFIKAEEFNNLRFALFLNFLFIFFAKTGINSGLIYTPSSFLDFGFIRYGLAETLNLDIRFTGYHQLGALALFSVVFLVAGNKKMNWLDFSVILLSIYFGLLAGARQMIYGIIVILFVYLINNVKSFFSKQVFFITMVFILFTIVMNSKNIPYVSNLLISRDIVETAGGRIEGYERALQLFNESPLFGKGLGGYDQTGESRDYPHNIVLEIIAEGGIFMILLILLSIYLAKSRGKFNWRRRTENESLFILLILGFVIRAFSSSDLTENVALISSLIAVSAFSQVQDGDFSESIST